MSAKAANTVETPRRLGYEWKPGNGLASYQFVEWQTRTLAAPARLPLTGSGVRETCARCGHWKRGHRGDCSQCGCPGFVAPSPAAERQEYQCIHCDEYDTAMEHWTRCLRHPAAVAVADLQRERDALKKQLAEVIAQRDAYRAAAKVRK